MSLILSLNSIGRKGKPEIKQHKIQSSKCSGVLKNHEAAKGVKVTGQEGQGGLCGVLIFVESQELVTEESSS